MYNKVLSGILIVLLIAIIITLGCLGYGYFTKYNNEKSAEKYLAEEFDTLIVDLNEQTTDVDNPEQQNNDNENANNQNNTNKPKKNTNTSPAAYYKGYKVAGKIEMPTIGKQFPILDEPQKAKAMEVSVVKVYGPDLNTPGNAVIGGHNYNNGTFFSRNKKLNVGDKIFITDMTGKRVEYRIFNKYYCPESDSTWFNRKSDGKTEVTLYTCDATGANRLIVCARAVE
jgi:LPXTG-site transpeptidase (sortase) family protein